MTVRLRDQVSTADTDGGMVLLDERAGRYWQLNPTGATVLRLYLDGATPSHIARTLTSKQPVSLEQATADVTAVLDHLRTAGLLHTPGRAGKGKK